MKSLLVSILAAVSLATSSLAADEINIQAKDAAQYIGETVVVSGTIADVNQFKGGSIVLNFDKPYPNEVFVASPLYS
jgi:hypothetical protein